MAFGDRQVSCEDSEADDCEDVKSSTEEHNSDDSEEDPTYDILEETCSGLSTLSLKRSRSRASRAADSVRKLELDDAEIEVAELDEKDKKCFENVEKIIKAGGLEKLTVEQCKVYLRKQGLRLTGKKDILIERIREHLCIIDGGEEKYPISSFVLNCKGDACTGDVVMFEQNVYEMYSIASRSANGPPIGTRIVAGRIVKESYGAAKQQHTFTIEVLWSKGLKPLPPLHPLLIKGRNLYRLKTMRQRWADEEERNKVLQEKHSRGFLARSNRETRIIEKELRKKLNEQRGTIKENNTFQNQNRLPQPNPMISLRIPQRAQNSAVPPNAVLTKISTDNNTTLQPKFIESQNSKFLAENSAVHGQRWSSVVCGEEHQNTGVFNRQRPLTNLDASRNLMHHVPVKDNGSSLYQNANEKLDRRQQTLRFINGVFNRQPLTNLDASRNLMHHVPVKDNGSSLYQDANEIFDRQQTSRFITALPKTGGHIQQQGEYYVQGRYHYGENCKYQREYTEYCMDSSLAWSPMKQKLCRYYAQGRCHYGDSCKFLHERK